ncbi:MAG: ABC transporter substrate-binding protein [Ketobacteraceae bacterium]|nr:ABC transporter substrate-binding protein [Ketobacteraceae bacterium]
MRLLITLVLAVLAQSLYAETERDPLRVTFINPDARGNAFWDNFSSFMAAAAKDLGVELRILYADKASRFEYQQLSSAILASPRRPDALVTILKRNAARRLFSECAEYRVDCFTVNTDLPSGEHGSIGKPREKFAHWVGQTLPDDKDAGEQLANILMQQFRLLPVSDSPRRGYMVALNGSGDSSAALERGEGLFQAIQGQPEVVFRQLLFTDWDSGLAYEKMAKLLERYPGTNIIWGASDAIALAATRAMTENGKLPGQDFVAGGIDWSREGIEAVRKGQLNVSIGGHFIEGAIALVLLHDRYHGKDFANDFGVRYKIKLRAIDAASPEQEIRRLQNQDWEPIDFGRFSKIKNSALDTYDFSIDNMLFGNPTEQ